MQNSVRTNSKERGVIFRADEVLATLDGRKMQFRRPIKPQPSPKQNWRGWVMSSTCSADEGKSCWAEVEGYVTRNALRLGCPYGQTGDLLYVRECFSTLVEFDFFSPNVPEVVPDYWYWADGNPEWGNWYKPRSGAVMPRAASRINLLVTGVRVERLHAITLGDICKEFGCGLYDFRPATYGFKVWEEWWQSLYGEESWQANPWVWVVEFERLAKDGGQ